MTFNKTFTSHQFYSDTKIEHYIKFSVLVGKKLNGREGDPGAPPSQQNLEVEVRGVELRYWSDLARPLATTQMTNGNKQILKSCCETTLVRQSLGET